MMIGDLATTVEAMSNTLSNICSREGGLYAKI